MYNVFGQKSATTQAVLDNVDSIIESLLVLFGISVIFMIAYNGLRQSMLHGESSVKQFLVPTVFFGGLITASIVFFKATSSSPTVDRSFLVVCGVVSLAFPVSIGLYVIYREFLSTRKEKEEVVIPVKAKSDEGVISVDAVYNVLLHCLELVSEKYIKAEIDPETLLVRPLLLDVSFPQTAHFHKTWDQAKVLAAKPKRLKFCEKYRSMTAQLYDAWDQMWDESEKIGIPHLDNRQRRQAKRYLDLIMDERTPQQERETALAKLNDLLQIFLGDNPNVLKHADKILTRAAITASHQPAIKNKW